MLRQRFSRPAGVLLHAASWLSGHRWTSQWFSSGGLQEQVHRAAAERRILLRRVASAHEDERRRLVEELHDGLASELLRALYAVRRINARYRPEPPAAGDLARLEEIIASSEAVLRTFMDRVRPAAIDHLGLIGAIEGAVARFGRETGFDVHLRVRGSPHRLDEAAGLAMVRAVDEAMLNVRKHAGATAVRVSLITGERAVVLVVEDNGAGFPVERETSPGRGLGLRYIRERAEACGGQVRLGRSRQGGARLLVELPVPGS